MRVSQVGFRNRARGRKEQAAPREAHGKPIDLTESGFSGFAACASCQPSRTIANQVVLNGFQGHGDQTIDAFLQHLRPVPLTAEERSKVLASLPRDGEVPSIPETAREDCSR